MSIKAKNQLKLWFTVLILLVLTLLVVLQQPYHPNDAQLQSMSKEELENEKLRQEILKLQLESKKLSNFWEQIFSSATFITASVALIGIVVTIRKQADEKKIQQERDRQQRRDDEQRRFDEKFTSIVSNLGSNSLAVQVGAAVSILTFLKPEYADFHDQVFMLILANLKIKHNGTTDTINNLLIEGFEKAIKIHLEDMKGKEFELDLSRSYLNGVDLSGLIFNNSKTHLCQINVSSAKLRDADLTDTELYRVEGIDAVLDKAKLSGANLQEAHFDKALFRGAQLDEANLVSAALEGADLVQANFYKARMQGARLKAAKLQGAKFERSNLSDAKFEKAILLNTFFNEAIFNKDTCFKGATLNQETLSSIVKAFNWQEAYFDEDIKAKLDKIARNSSL